MIDLDLAYKVVVKSLSFTYFFLSFLSFFILNRTMHLNLEQTVSTNVLLLAMC